MDGSPDDIGAARARWAASDDELVVERRGNGVVVLVLNRPAKLNAITPAMFDGLARVFDEVATNPDDRVLVVTGAGDAFSSGADIGGAPKKDGRRDDRQPAPPEHDPHASAVVKARRISEPAVALHRLAKPTIAAVNGIATGAGASIALGCDLAVAGESARFAMVFVRVALGLDLGATWLLPRLVGLQRARYLAFTGDWMSASEAERHGMVLEVCPDGDPVVARALELADRLAEMPRLALSVMKTSLNRSFEMSFHEMIDHECQMQAACSLSADYREAIRAFREKRPARF